MEKRENRVSLLKILKRMVVLFGLRLLNRNGVVAVAMKSDFVEVCVHCRRNSRVRISDDVGFYFHWDDKHFLIDTVLLLPFKDSFSGFALFRMMYVFKSRVLGGLNARA